MESMKMPQLRKLGPGTGGFFASGNRGAAFEVGFMTGGFSGLGTPVVAAGAGANCFPQCHGEIVRGKAISRSNQNDGVRMSCIRA